MKILTFILLFCSSITCFTQTKYDTLTIEKAISRYRISGISFSPDEKKISFVVTEPVKGNTSPNSDIWIYDIESKRLFQFTWSPKSDTNPKWSPDGKYLAFLSSRSGESQVYLIRVDGGEAFPLSASKTSVEEFEWSPDGKAIAFLATEPMSDDEDKKTKENDDGAVADKEKPSRLWLINVESHIAVKKMLPEWEISEIKWLHDNKSLALVIHTLPKTETDIPELKLYHLIDSSMTTLQSPVHPFWGEVRFAADSKSYNYISARKDGPTMHDLLVQSLDSHDPINLTAKNPDLPVNEYRLMTDGSVMFSAQKGFYSRLFKISPSGTISSVTISQNIGIFDVSSSGAIAFTSISSVHPEELWLRLPDQDPIKITSVNKAFDSFHLIKPEIIRYKSFDGLTIEGSYFKPDNSKGPHPLVVLVHGGPTGAWFDNYSFWNQLFLDKGYAVFCPNVRGSSGYGWDFATKNKNDWGGGDFKDILAGVDFLVGRGDIDANRVGIAGWSYGGYMAMWAVTQTNRFKAAMAGAGMSDLASEFGTEQGSEYDTWFLGTPYRNPKNFADKSPITFVANAKTPTLIIQGALDPIDPVGQSQQFYHGLRHYGVTTELVIYPREHHGFTEQRHIIDYMKRTLAWFDRFMK